MDIAFETPIIDNWFFISKDRIGKRIIDNNFKIYNIDDFDVPEHVRIEFFSKIMASANHKNKRKRDTETENNSEEETSQITSKPRIDIKNYRQSPRHEFFEQPPIAQTLVPQTLVSPIYTQKQQEELLKLRCQLIKKKQEETLREEKLFKIEQEKMQQKEAVLQKEQEEFLQKERLSSLSTEIRECFQEAKGLQSPRGNHYIKTDDDYINSPDFDFKMYNLTRKPCLFCKNNLNNENHAQIFCGHMCTREKCLNSKIHSKQECKFGKYKNYVGYDVKTFLIKKNYPELIEN